MWVSELQLASYRNYEQLNIQLAAGPTLIFGENGRGKTNLVEALGFLANLESHRSGAKGTLVKQGHSTAQISATANHNGRAVKVAAEISTEKTNTFFLNSKPQRRASDVLGNLSVVIFAPEDLDIVRRDPSDRRAFLDVTMASLKPRLGQLKADYDRVLKQRNALLKSARGVKDPDISTLEIWDDQLVALGSEIIKERAELITKLAPPLQSFYTALADSDDVVSLRLVSLGEGDIEEQIDRQHIAQQLRARLAEKRAAEFERGITLVGPHRDDLVIEKNDLVARTHASQGEAWSIALGLRLAVASLLRDGPGGDPILILDDVFAVLDSGRRKRLVDFVVDYEQVLVTSADKDMAPDLSWSKKLEVLGGEVRET